MKKSPASLFIVLLTLLLPFIITSCKPEEEIGFEVQPPEDKIIIGFNNENGLDTYSIPEDSVRSDKTLLNLIGSCFDPVFGTTVAGTFTQFRLPDNNVSFGPNPIVDSLVLSIVYEGYYGNINTGQSFKVYEASNDFYKDSIYYSNTPIPCYPAVLANLFFLPKPGDSIIVDGVKSAPQLRIRLDNALAQKFINASGSAELANNENFTAFFKGLYVVADPCLINGSILYFSLLNASSKLTLYYHNDEYSTLSYSFVINENSARINTFDHLGYAGANHDFQQQVAGDTLRGKQILYLQAMAGVKTFIRFPDLKNIINAGDIIINKAELIIPIHPADNEDFARPSKLTLVKIENDGTLSFLPDELYGSSYFGGTYISASGEYRFNISTYIQNLMIDYDYAGKGLYLAISGSAVNGGRLVINGPATTSNNLRLEITYTRIHY